MEGYQPTHDTTNLMLVVFRHLRKIGDILVNHKVINQSYNILSISNNNNLPYCRSNSVNSDALFALYI